MTDCIGVKVERRGSRLCIREDDVGAAGEVFDVEAEAVGHFVEERADEEFGLRVLPLDAGHIPRPPFF